MTVAQTFTASNSKISISFPNRPKFVLLGFESFSITDNLEVEGTYDPNRNTSGQRTLKGAIEPDQLSTTSSIENKELINLINELFDTREVGSIIITHKEDTNRILVMEAWVRTRSVQTSGDDSSRSKIIFNFAGKITKNTY